MGDGSRLGFQYLGRSRPLVRDLSRSTRSTRPWDTGCRLLHPDGDRAAITGDPCADLPAASSPRLKAGLNQAAAHQRIAEAVLSALDVPGEAVLEARVGFDANDEVVPAESWRQQPP